MNTTAIENIPLAAYGELIPTARLIPERQRMGFLPKLFGNRLFMLGEGVVYHFMGDMCSADTGGLWAFVAIPDGTGYMRPKANGTYSMSCAGNQWEGDVSADAAGIIVTLMALSQMSFDDQTDTCAENFHALRDFVSGHPEAKHIYRAID